MLDKLIQKLLFYVKKWPRSVISQNEPLGYEKKEIFTEKEKVTNGGIGKKFEQVNGHNYSKFMFNDITTLISLLFQTLVEWNNIEE